MLTAEQLQERKTGLGGSDLAAVLNLNPYKTPFELWQEKTGRVMPEDISGRFAIRRGNDMEALVAKWFSEETGLEVRRVNQTLRNEDHPYLIGHIDRRIVGRKEGLECKTANWRMLSKFGESGSDAVPPYYLMQCVHYMIVTGWRKWHLAADLGGEFRIFEINWDAELADYAARTAHEWWQRHIVEDVAPEPTTPREVDLAYATAEEGETIEASPDVADLIEKLAEVNAELKELEATDKDLRAQIKAAMGSAESLTFDGKRLATWKNQTRRSFNTKSFQSDHPGLFETYQTESSFRVFRPNLK